MPLHPFIPSVFLPNVYLVAMETLIHSHYVRVSGVSHVYTIYERVEVFPWFERTVY